MGILAKRKRKRAMGEIPMASTSDVAFLLLIFFIVMPMKQDEIGISLVLPGKTAQPTVRIRQSNVATIRVHADHHLTLDNQPVRLSDIQDIIRRRVAENDKTVVILETHPDADYGMMIACLDEVKLSGARKFTLKTTQM
ncbi:biopolymer transporter ExbD [bacterium]|nr:biopolymer transporter ExbD [bacterium]MBU1072363.1 biopolymer transporter ExbD [bacterium]MBU1677044.1 biopolymer transporter ExbD [bacterium]